MEPSPLSGEAGGDVRTAMPGAQLGSSSLACGLATPPQGSACACPRAGGGVCACTPSAAWTRPAPAALSAGERLHASLALAAGSMPGKARALPSASWQGPLMAAQRLCRPETMQQQGSP